MKQVIIGVDPHKLSATIEVVDAHEQLMGSGRFSTDQAGYTAMRTYAKTWPERVWAIEGSNGAGRPLAQRLLESGEHVVDVPAKLAARVRLFDTGHNRKTNARDAHSIAIVALGTTTLRVLRRDGELEALRMLCDRRESSPDSGSRPSTGSNGCWPNGAVALHDRAGHETGVMTSSSPSAFVGFRFPREVISVAVRWYLRYGLSYRDVEGDEDVMTPVSCRVRWLNATVPRCVLSQR